MAYNPEIGNNIFEMVHKVFERYLMDYENQIYKSCSIEAMEKIIIPEIIKGLEILQRERPETCKTRERVPVKMMGSIVNGLTGKSDVMIIERTKNKTRAF